VTSQKRPANATSQKQLVKSNKPKATSQKRQVESDKLKVTS
jgi:hypothetical protein